jgi:branched-chain amino acid transport system permease protein
VDFLAQQIINGVLLGSTYALIALGFTLIFGILNVLNLAQAEMVTWGAYSAYLLNIYLGFSFPAALVGAIVFAGCLGILVERLAIRPVSNPFREAEQLSPLIASIGVAMVLQNLAIRVFEPKGIPFPLGFSGVGLDVGRIHIAGGKLSAFGISIIVMGLLMGILYRTNLGKKIRATAEDPKAAIFLGVNVYSIFSIVMFMSGALGGIGGVLMASIYGIISPFMGANLGLKGLVVMIIGGVSSLSGAVVGGLLLGVGEALIIGYISSAYVDAVAFGAVTLVLIARPQGLLPSFK